MSGPVSLRPKAGHSVPLLVLATLSSGGAALIYETVWTRSFAIVLGSTVQAASVTFAAFLTGLALGAYLFGRRSAPLRFTVHAYIATEVAIALSAPALGLLIHDHADALAVLMGASSLPKPLIAFSTVLLLVLVPTLLMGGTFPLVLTVARRLGGPLTVVSRIYAWNTLGAALGTVACGFFLIRLYGVQVTLSIGGSLNLLAALLCLPLCRYSVLPEAEQRSPHESLPSARPEGRIPEGLLLSIAAGSGFMVLALESVWVRLASYFLGNRTYAFTTLLACVLLLLAVGSSISARLVDRWGRRPHDLFGWTLVTSLAMVALCTAAMWWWIQHQELWERGLPALNGLLLIYRALETFILLAPMLIALGTLFPMSLICSHTASRSMGRTAGNFYLVNTAGSVVGALGVGFWGISVLGVFGCVMVILLGGGLLTLHIFICGAGRGSGRLPLPRLAATTAALALAIFVPNRLVLIPEDEELLYRQEDEHGILQVVKRPDGVIKVTNNRTELIYYLGLPHTSYVQQMQGHLGMFYNPSARTALVIGSGYGLTAGALTRYPQLERIDAVEIIPGMLDAADLFQPFHYNYHRDPRVTLVADDGRHYLARGTEKYDIISVNVSDPHLPGGSSLFHKDFYEVAKRHLNEGGVVIQHAFGSDIELVIRTLLESFRDVRMVRAYGNGYNVVASDHSLNVQAASADALLRVPTVRASLEDIGMLFPVTPGLVLKAALTREDVQGRLDMSGPIATDDHPLLEFAWSENQGLLLFSNE